MTATHIENAIAVRCAALGLSLPQAQALADAEPFPSDLMYVLGLNPETLTPLSPKPWLYLAARTSSVSYRTALTAEMLLAVLIKGNAPVEFQAHLAHFLNEVPMQLVVMAIEQAAQQSGMPISDIWGNIVQLNRTVHGRRLDAMVKARTLPELE